MGRLRQHLQCLIDVCTESLHRHLLLQLVLVTTQFPLKAGARLVYFLLVLQTSRTPSKPSAIRMPMVTIRMWIAKSLSEWVGPLGA